MFGITELSEQDIQSRLDSLTDEELDTAIFELQKSLSKLILVLRIYRATRRAHSQR